MQIEGLTWPPRPDEYYLEPSPHRPVTQGDVFGDVPFVKNKRASKITDDPNSTAERRLVVVMGYTCDLYTEAGTLGRVQVVAPVIDASKAGIPPDWAGAYNFAPLPDLLGDGTMYAVDLRAASNIDAFYLDPTKRVRCLSELGWAAFRQRIGLSFQRLINQLEDLAEIGRDVWAEIELWEQWNAAGLPSAEFQRWLDVPQATLSGFTLRAWLYRGAVHEVRKALVDKLASPPTAPAAKKTGARMAEAATPTQSATSTTKAGSKKAPAKKTSAKKAAPPR